jgi:carboxyl-terminal processing protease
MWMEQGEIVDIVDRQGGHQSFAANGSALTNLPLVVLVDGNSASASEILAGALKENSRATIVGTNTYGKGTVQSVHSLSDGSGLAVTISRYYPPSGININKKGIKPDIFQDLSLEAQNNLAQDPSLIATLADPQYAKAIAVLKSVGTISTPPNTEPVSIRN